jgi:RimJ/RimL family protein N-acetyltransferase
VFDLLVGKTVNLRVVEKDDLSIIKGWVNDLMFIGEYRLLPQETLGELGKQYEQTISMGGRWFFIEKKDGRKIGYVAHYLARKQHEIGYGVIPEERGRGYGTEAATMIVDYLFLTKDLMRVQADADRENVASQRVLEKVGFTKEGVLRKVSFEQGEWRDAVLYSLLRDEWKRPKILTALG